MVNVDRSTEDKYGKTEISDLELDFGIGHYIAEAHHMVHDEDELDLMEKVNLADRPRGFCRDKRSGCSHNEASHV